MADFEFQDSITDFPATPFTEEFKLLFWREWNKIRDKRWKGKWGIFRPSFHYRVIEPALEIIFGPRIIT